MAATGTYMYMYGCFELAGLFASSLQKDASSIDSRGTTLSPISRKQPQKHGKGKKLAANYGQVKDRNSTGVVL